MKLPGLLTLALIISINVFSFDKSNDYNIVTKDEIISLNKDFQVVFKETIWRNNISDMDNINSNLISIDHPINISGYTKIDLRFSQEYKSTEHTKTFVELSLDGENWTSIEVNKKITNNIEVNNNIVIDISFLTIGEENLWIRFNTNNNITWLTDNIELRGIITLFPEITTVNPNSGNQGESLSIALSGQYTHFTQGSETVWFEQASQTIMTGNNINITSLTEMSLDIEIPLTAPVGLYDVKVQNLTDGIITKLDGFEVFPGLAPNWSYATTGIEHQVLIPSFASLTIDGTQINYGDYIGVFYDSMGTLACGGYAGWYGNSVILSISGDDPFTTDKDGFDISESFTWKLWDASVNTEYEATATYQVSGFPNTEFFTMNGNSGLSSIEAFTYQTQTITLAQGWDIYSTFINPVDPSLESIFAPIIADLLIIKNGDGQVYWPPFVNLIGNMTIGEGYQINMSAQNSVNIIGSSVVPELTPISIPYGWSIIGYLRQSPGNAVTMFSTIVNDIVIVKDGWGSVYWPQWSVNNIGNLVPGGGYQIRTYNTTTLLYPANIQGSKSVEYLSTYPLEHYSRPENTGNNMTLGIPLCAWENKLLPGDEIGIFNSVDELVGCAVFENENLAISIWGDDEFTKDKIEYLSYNEAFKLKLYTNSTGIEHDLNISEWIEGGSLFTKDGLSVVNKISISSEVVELQNSPNPCRNVTTISFELASDSHTVLNIYNSLGELVMNILNSELPSGIHSFDADISSLNAGTYFYKLSTSNKEVSKQLIIIK